LLSKFEPDVDKLVTDWSHKKSKERQNERSPVTEPRTTRKEDERVKFNRRKIFLSPGASSPQASLDHRSEATSKRALESEEQRSILTKSILTQKPTIKAKLESSIKEDNKFTSPRAQKSSTIARPPLFQSELTSITEHQFNLFDIETIDQDEGQAYLEVVQKYMKVYRSLFDSYSKQPQSMSESRMMGLGEVNKLLSDFKLQRPSDKSSTQQSRTLMHQKLKNLLQQIFDKENNEGLNYRLKNIKSEVSFSGFIEFML
jgi:hypothetical protein